MAQQTPPAGEVFTSCWFGERLLPFANACINTFKAHGFRFALYTHGAVQDVPAFVTRHEVESIVAKGEVMGNPSSHGRTVDVSEPAPSARRGYQRRERALPVFWKRPSMLVGRQGLEPWTR